MLKYPLSTLLYIAKINIKDTIQDSLKLHNNVDVKLTIEVKNKNGKVIKQHKQHSHSFVESFLNYLYILWTQTSPVPAANMNYVDGLQIGTGTTTPTPNDTALTSPIANGKGSGQMVYPSAPTFTAPVVSGDTTSMTIKSMFVNNSGASITVTEVGLFTQWTSNDYGYGMITHDLLSSPVTVPNNASITIIYTISVTT